MADPTTGAVLLVVLVYLWGCCVVAGSRYGGGHGALLAGLVGPLGVLIAWAQYHEARQRER